MYFNVNLKLLTKLINSAFVGECELRIYIYIYIYSLVRLLYLYFNEIREVYTKLIWIWIKFVISGSPRNTFS